ncbi:hypothetical protein CVT24_011602 [Panaeolus cyanescens]|uniref:HAT C-terminal dimerisation domain-containing protein n=1 Tax=Panaeolus cyanescens TaxID=181874 RepID=A0A409YGV2_9AGAR|nr:hypothetical protein CVT24_011602 [Panaeolus cyanescens]
MRKIESCCKAEGIPFDEDGNHNRCFPHVINIAASTIAKELKENPRMVVSSFLETTDHELSNEEMQALSEYEDAVASDPVGISRTIVSSCRSSGQRRAELKSIIIEGNKAGIWQLKVLQLLRDVETRWSSYFLMIGRIIYLYTPLLYFLIHSNNGSLSHLKFSPSQWKVLNDIHDIFEIPHATQELLSAEKTPTIALALPAFELLIQGWLNKQKAIPELAHFIGVGIHKIQEYVQKCRRSRIYGLAMKFRTAQQREQAKSMQDPVQRSSSLPNLSQNLSQSDLASQKLQKGMNHLLTLSQSSSFRRTTSLPILPSTIVPPSPTPHTPLPGNTASGRSNRPIQSLLSSLTPQRPANLSQFESDEPTTPAANTELSQEELDRREAEQLAKDREVAEEEFARYLDAGLSTISDTDNLVHYWDVNEHRFPLMFCVALDVLPVQASAVPCERIFSSSKETCTDRRNRILPRLLEVLQFRKFKLKQARLDFMDSYICKEEDYSIEGNLTRNAIEELLRLGPRGAEELAGLIQNSRESLQETTVQMPSGRRSYYETRRHPDPKARINRIVEMVEICLASGDLSPCTTLFDSLIQPGDIKDPFEVMYTPLVPLLKNSLTKYGHDVLLEPFKSFFRCLISLHLGRLPDTRSLACGCTECERVNRWLLGNSKSMLKFSTTLQGQKHLEREMDKVRLRKIITCNVIRSRGVSTVELSKRDTSNGNVSQVDPTSFIYAIGDDDVLQKVMEERRTKRGLTPDEEHMSSFYLGSASEEEEGNIDRTLNADLSDTLSEDRELFEAYYHRSVEGIAPITGLKIEKLGLIDLPLTEQEAQRIIRRASQEKLCNSQTVITPSMPHSLEIDSAYVSFENSAWQGYFERSVKVAVQNLGAKNFMDRLKCRFSKLVLQKEGFYSSPLEDVVVGTDGTFATTTIILPSAHHGGQVHLTHAGRNTVLDVSSYSQFNISILAWHSGVTHDVKHITSGYRLSLSYDIIYTPTPVLHAPSQLPLDKLRKILKKWKNGGYNSTPHPLLYACMLTSTYSHDSDKDWDVKKLEGWDADFLARSLPIFTELGFVLSIADLTKIDVDRHDGREKLGLGPKDLSFEPDAIVPRDAFDGLREDKVEPQSVEGWPDTLWRYYHRSAFVIFLEDEEEEVIKAFGGAANVVRQLPVTNSPTQYAQRMVKAALAKPLDNNTAISVLNHAVAWEQHDIWNQAIPFVTDPATAITEICRAIGAFGQDLFSERICDLIQKRLSPKGQHQLNNELPAPLGPHVPFIQNGALSCSLKAPLSHFDFLLHLVQNIDGGIKQVAPRDMPKIADLNDSFDRCVELLKEWNKIRQELLDSPRDSGTEYTESKRAIRQCLNVAISKWNDQPPPSGSGSLIQTPWSTVLSERVKTLVNLCHSTSEDRNPCIELFELVGKKSKDYQLDVVLAIHDLNPSCVSAAWAVPLMRTVLYAYSTPDVAHIPLLTQMTEEILIGPYYVLNMLLGLRIQHKIIAPYEFLMGLAMSLHRRFSELSGVGRVLSDNKKLVHLTIVYCVVHSIPRWEDDLPNTLSQDNSPHHRVVAPTQTPNAAVARVMQIVDLCLTLKELGPCAFMFRTLVHLKNAKDMFSVLYIPLVPLLKKSLAEHQRTILDEPFKSFFGCLISLHLGKLFGSVPRTKSVVGCDSGLPCKECDGLNAWLSSDNPTRKYKAEMKTQTHVLREIARGGLKTIVTCTTITSGPDRGLELSKREKVRTPRNWKRAQESVQAFMQNIGDSEVLQKIMEDRYKDFKKASSGEAEYVVGELVIVSPVPSVAGPGIQP